MTNFTFHFNLWQSILVMSQYAFMRNAWAAGTAVALVAGLIGYFIVLRRSAFAAHALSHIGFAGAAGAVLLGLNPFWGLLLFTTGGGTAIAILDRRTAGRDVTIGIILAFMLGLGVLFISLYSGYATAAYSLLFGEILGISAADVNLTLGAGLILLIALGLIYRPLLFSSLDEEAAEAKGLPVGWLGLIMMILIALTTTIAVQVVGVLLIFALMVAPAATAQLLARRPAQGLLLSALIALGATWLGLFLSFYWPYPVSFFITTITFLVYLAVRFWPGRRRD